MLGSLSHRPHSWVSQNHQMLDAFLEDFQRLLLAMLANVLFNLSVQLKLAVVSQGCGRSRLYTPMLQYCTLVLMVFAT